MRYQRAYQFFFTSPNWVTNMLGGAICMLVPVFGWAAFSGYAMEVVESTSKSGQRGYPSFDLNQMGQYMKRGTGPLLVQLILFTPVFFLIALALIVGTLTLGTRPTSGATLGLPTGMPDRNDQFLISASTGMAAGILALTLVLSLVTVPMSLYVGLRQELSLAGAIEFVPDFLKRVGKELLLAEIFILVTGLCALVFGMAVCCVGVFPAAAWANFAQHHLMAQLYSLYLERGGAPIAAAASVGAA